MEQQVLTDLLKSSREFYESDAAAAEQLVAIGMSLAGADLPRVELAAWTSASRALLNMSELTTRN
jgi:hypothetical protein